MTFVSILWPMISAACLTLAVIHFFAWLSQRDIWANLLFSIFAANTAVLAGLELAMMHARTPQEYGVLMRWYHVPAAALILSMMGFVGLYFRSGRPWLAWAAAGTRGAALGLNFILTPNLNYREITGLRPVNFLGESVSIPVAVPNPWMIVGNLSLLLTVLFVADATLTAWRRGDRRRALVVGGSILFFATAGTLHALLAMWQIVPSPVTTSCYYLVVVIAMGHQLSQDLLRAARLSRELLTREGQLRESESRFRSVANTAPVMIWMSGTDRHCNFFNKGWLDFTGRPLEQELGDGWAGGVHADDLVACLKTYAEAFDARRPFTMEYRLRRHDGEYRWVTDTGVARFDAVQAFLGYIGSCVDITDGKQAGEELLQNRNELAHLSRVVMLGELSTSLAHELNQPLGAILRNAEAAEMILQQPSPDLDELRAIVADIHADDRRAGDVIDRLRSLLKNRPLESRAISLTTLVDEVMRFVRADAHARGVTLALDVPSDLSWVRGDRVHLQQVLLNLIMNAMDAVHDRPPSERRVTIRTMLNASKMVEVAVGDSGGGIPAESLPRVFEPFFTTKGNGMGIGLAVSRTIIEAHRGKIWARNNADRGATISFTVPAAAKGGDA